MNHQINNNFKQPNRAPINKNVGFNPNRRVGPKKPGSRPNGANKNVKRVPIKQPQGANKTYLSPNTPTTYNPVNNNSISNKNLSQINLSSVHLNKNRRRNPKNIKNKISVPNTYNKNKTHQMISLDAINLNGNNNINQPKKLQVNPLFNSHKNQGIKNVKVNLDTNTKENLPIDSIEKNEFTLKELMNLNVDSDKTEKVFVKGVMKYKIKDQKILDAIASGEWFEEPKIEETISDNQNEQVIENQQLESEFANVEVVDTNQEVQTVEYGDQNIVDNNQTDLYKDQPLNVDLDKNKSLEDFDLNLPASKIVETWNKNLWKQEDVLYKLYNLSYNKNNDPLVEGSLKNISLDIFPGDRIAIMSNDSYSDSLLLDVLTNKKEKESGYIFCNLKRGQKWLDVYSEEFKGFNVEQFNQKNTALYQLKSPNYIAYANSKNDTIASTFKKIFKAYQAKIDETILNNLLSLLQLDKEMKLKIVDATILHNRKINFICDVLFKKKVIVLNNITSNLDVRQKMNFYRYINNLYQNSDTVIIFNVKDTIEVKLFANRLVMIDEGELLVNKRLKDILNTFETLDLFIVSVFDNLNKKYIEKR